DEINQSDAKAVSFVYQAKGE
nr:porin OmpU=outer membrane protein 38 kda monomeric subunit {N-terminal} [Vibrio cholerae, 569B, Peptide Partial, 20 aa] [Vibrio cholerae]